MSFLANIGNVMGKIVDFGDKMEARKQAFEDTFGQKIFGKSGWEGFKKYQSKSTGSKFGSKKELKRTQQGLGPSYTDE